MKLLYRKTKTINSYTYITGIHVDDVLCLDVNRCKQFLQKVLMLKVWDVSSSNNNKHLLNILNSQGLCHQGPLLLLTYTCIQSLTPPSMLHVSLKMLRKGHHSSDVRPNSFSWIRRSACCLGRRIQFKTCTCGYFQEKKCRTYRTDLWHIVILIEKLALEFLIWSPQWDWNILLFIWKNNLLSLIWNKSEVCCKEFCKHHSTSLTQPQN